MKTSGDAAAFTLVEVMVATALLAMVALGLTSTLIAAQRGRAQSEQSMHAIQLAAEAIERLRADRGTVIDPPPAGFERTTRVAPWSGHPGLDLLEVTTSWNDGTAHSFQVVTLARRAQ
jgi:prepilin-type N-terminal cleavage/methylation domain-containing protein